MQIRVANLNQVVQTCEAMRKRSLHVHTSSWRTYCAKGYFEKATFHGRSIVTLMEMFRSNKQPLDIAGVCVLSRCILEVHNAAAYLLEFGLSKAESELRYYLFRLNRSSDLKKINNGFGIKDIDDRNSFNAVAIERLHHELHSNPIFQALDEPHRKSLLKGKYPYLSARYTGKKPVPRSIESAAYNLFSHNVHSFSLGLSPMYEECATPAGGANRRFLAIELATIYMSNIALLYWRLRSKAIKTLTDEERDALIKGASTAYLENWLSNLQSNNMPSSLYPAY